MQTSGTTATATTVPAAADDGGPMIQLDNVNKWYGQFHVLRDVTIQVVRQDPNLFFTTGREDYIAAWDPDAGKVRYSDRFPSVTELVAKYLANYGY